MAAKKQTENSLTLPCKVGRVRVVDNSGNLGIRFALDYKDYRIGKLGAITPENIKLAIAKAQLIDSDISLQCFDPTLAKYTDVSRHAQTQSKQPSKALETQTKTVDVIALWDKFTAYKSQNGAKAKTQDAWLTIRKNLVKADINKHGFSAIAIKSALILITTEQQTRRALQHLSAMCEWCIRFDLLSSNPFKGMSEDMPKPAYSLDPSPNAFSESEMIACIASFKESKKYSHFAPFIEFLFATGCRPSEACGLQWDQIADDFTSIKFDRSLQNLNGEIITEKRSKTNRVRLFPCNQNLQNLLKAVKPIDCNPKALVFTGIKGSALNYRYFSDKPFGIAREIKADCTPYSCRDTFISLQLLKGTPSAVIAKWCDTSTTMIDKYYTDASKFLSVLPK